MGIKGIKEFTEIEKLHAQKGKIAKQTNLNDCFVTIKTTPGLLSIKALEVLKPRSLVDYE